MVPFSAVGGKKIKGIIFHAVLKLIGNADSNVRK